MGQSREEVCQPRSGDGRGRARSAQPFRPPPRSTADSGHRVSPADPDGRQAVPSLTANAQARWLLEVLCPGVLATQTFIASTAPGGEGDNVHVVSVLPSFLQSRADSVPPEAQPRRPPRKPVLMDQSAGEMSRKGALPCGPGCEVPLRCIMQQPRDGARGWEGVRVGWPEALLASTRTLEFVPKANGKPRGCCGGLSPDPQISLSFATRLCVAAHGGPRVPARPARPDLAARCTEVCDVPVQCFRQCTRRWPVSHWPEENEGPRADPEPSLRGPAHSPAPRPPHPPRLLGSLPK